MKICVVVPTFNNCDFLLPLLRQLQNLPNNDQLTIVVVDNGSSDGTSKRVKQRFPEVNLLALPENSGGSGGFIAGVNQAMTLKVDYIWLLDDDVVIKDDTLEQLLISASKLDKQEKSWGAIGSMMADLNKLDQVVETGAEVNWKRCRFNLYDNGKSVDNIKAEIKPVQYCAAASLLTRPDVIKDAGFFENIFIHFDDVEWCLRLKKSGYGIFCNTESVFWHATVKGAPVTWVRYYDCRNFLWLCRNYKRQWLMWGFFCMIFKGLYFRMHRMPAMARLYRQGIKDAFSGRLRMRKDLEVEDMIQVQELLPEILNRNIIAVFQNRKSLNYFRKLHPDIMDVVKKIFLYEKAESGCQDLRFSKLRKLTMIFHSVLYMTCRPGCLVVLDGQCYHTIIGPPLINDAFYLFFRHNKAIKRMRWRS